MFNKISTVFVCLVLLILTSWGCRKGNDEDTNTDVATVQTSLQVDRWSITYFIDEGVDRTNDFRGFLFTFNSNGSISAVNNLFTVAGNWSVVKDGNFTKVNIAFTSPSTFQNLTENWRVNTHTFSRLSMQDAKSNGTTSFLTFEK